MRNERRSINVLHLEDDLTDALQFRRTTEKHSAYKLVITHALTMNAALNALKHRKSFDLVVCDLDLPDTTSAETTLKRVRHLTTLPLIVLTGLIGAEIEGLIADAGGVHLPKDAGSLLPAEFFPRAFARAFDDAVADVFGERRARAEARRATATVG